MNNLAGWRAIAAFGVTGVLFLGTFAEAAPISFADMFNPADVYMDNKGDAVCTGDTTADTVSDLHCQTLEFTYVLAGFNPLTDTLASGSLTLTFYDDSDSGPGTGGSHSETVNISLDGIVTSNSPALIANGATSFESAFNVLAQLADGELTILLRLGSEGSGNNDFYFAGSRLIVGGERSETSPQNPPESAPEPASLLLLGTAGIGILSRHLRRKQV